MLVISALTLTAALVLGGGTRVGFLSDVALQLLSIPLLLAALAAHWSLPRERRARWVLAAASGLVLIPLLQVIPLPAGIWPLLPRHNLVAEAFEVSGASPVAFPLSLTPRETWLAAVSLITPIGIFLGTVLLSYSQRRSLTVVLIGVGMVSVVLGLLQVAQGPASPLRFFEFTNTTEAVGFFANRNHLAALIYTLIAFVGAWVSALSMTPAGQGNRNRADSSWILYFVVGLSLLTVLLAAQAMARSRAGLGLTVVALGGVFALTFFARRPGAAFGAGRAMAGAIVVAAFMMLPFALGRVLEALARDPLQDSRLTFARITIEAARSFLPWGSGSGSFVPVYQMFEKPSEMLIDVYVNRAHNDILEIALETGIIGAGSMVLFSIWLAVRGVQVWRRGEVTAQPIDVLLARAAVIAATLIAIHCAFDYPLRTGALMAVMAVCCALLVPPILAAAETTQPLTQESRAKSTSSRPLHPVTIAPVPSNTQAQADEDVPERPGAAPTAWPGDRTQQQPASDLHEAATRHWQGQSMPADDLPEASINRLDAQAPSKTPPSRRQAQDQIAWPDSWTSPVLRNRSSDKY